MGVKVKAIKGFEMYHNGVLKLPKKDYRALQKGKSVEISESLFKKYKIFKEVKDGN